MVADVVRWTDSGLWHVHCLLDKLAAVDILLLPEPPEEKTASDNPITYWGVSPP
jgi:hypothetical protein